jgi:hypothetical protein
MTMEEYEGIKIIHTYKGKEVTQTFFKNNIHLFKAPNTRVLLKALEILETQENPTRKQKLFIDEFGKVNHNSPKE